MEQQVGASLAGVPATFTEHVRDALLNLYDPAGLRQHALLALAEPAVPAGVARGHWLRGSLLDAIEALQPGPGVAAMSRPWRTYRVLELRYIEGYDVAGATEQLALSRSQYHREHQRALAAVADLLWERWRLAERRPAAGAGGTTMPRPPTPPATADLVPAGSAAEHVDPIAVLHGVQSVLQPLCRRHDVDLRCRLPARAPAIRGERVALRQALLTVLAHAVAATADPVLDLTLAGDARAVVIRLDGVGAAAAIRIGIAESEPFVAALQGTLEASVSAEAVGRWTVTLRFPASERPALLVVDNHADFIHLVERYVDEQPWEVVAAGDVDLAVARARQRRPRAILLDVVIPGRDGWELLEELKASPATASIPVVVCSVLDEPEMALALGAAAYLHKPITRQQLLDALTALT